MLTVDTDKGKLRDYLQTEIVLLERLVKATLAPEVAASRRRQLTNILYDLFAGYVLLPDSLRKTGLEERSVMIDYLLAGLTQAERVCASADGKATRMVAYP